MEENISGKIRDILNNMPSNLSELEKIRWIYISLGSILSYDFRKLDFNKKININDEYISKYQTCVQISDLLYQMLNTVGIKCDIYEREEDKLHFDQAHQYNEITAKEDLEYFIDEGDKIVLDLVYDLPYIQNNFRTQNFGAKAFGLGYAAISPIDEKIIDEKLGFYPNGYKDTEIDEFRRYLDRSHYAFNSYEEELDFIIGKVQPYLNPNVDFVEGTNILDNKLFEDIVRGLIIRHNLVNSNLDKIRVYLFNKGEDKVWYLYSNGQNIVKSSEEEVRSLLDNGWVNKSGSIYNYLEQNKRL